MTLRPRINVVLILAILSCELLFISGCKKDPVLATITTKAVSDITVSTAKTGGNISSDGGATVTVRGVCWGTGPLPEVTGPHTADDSGNGEFSSNLTGLSPNTLYYARAYATNEAGTAYGNEVSFSTDPVLAPVLNTIEVSGITASSAISGGNISSDGGAEVTARGICWSATANPTTADAKTTNGTGPGIFSANLTGLLPGTTYHIRAYATNSAGTSYGNDLPFTTLAVTPAVTTAAVTSVTRHSAVSGGNITSNGGAAITARGVCWSTSSNPTLAGTHTVDGSGNGSFTSNITGLTPNTQYYVRAYATNSAGTSYGNELTFTTSPVQIPTLVTAATTNVTLNTAVSGGNIISDNGGNITERGVCWNLTGNPTTSGNRTTDGAGTGNFVSNISGLNSGTVYYVRAYATNSVGTAYGNELRFSTSVADIEGNIYKSVIIGNQVWMQSDLKTTHLNDNTPVPNVTGNSEWAALTSMAYCWYDNNPSYGNTYGILYNWYTVENGDLCPVGWHVPTDEEFKTLEIYLGMTTEQANGFSWRGTDQGTQLKSTATWLMDGTNTNSSGFTALGGGYRFGFEGTFNNLGTVSYWWSSSLHPTDATKALYRRLDSGRTGVFREGVIKAGGKFVRCLKN